ncbi:MAG TPA: Hsp20/alpha crystallin family protein [Saprospiraceae bacterium]|nr:Hsp20/alpha crystallin family protein [Saprospiraceae bacterium]HMQ81751.1 Hsp20/alpha crystallin family protein [Saprospiraceae bacterium]
MIRPDIKTYRDNLRDHYISPLTDRPHFMGRKAIDVRWNKEEPAANIKKTGDEFELEVAMPGFTREEISISLEGDVLTILAEKQVEEENVSSEFVLREFDHNILERRFKFTKPVQEDQIKARYMNGMLKLNFTIKEEELTDAVKKVEVV